MGALKRINHRCGERETGYRQVWWVSVDTGCVGLGGCEKGYGQDWYGGCGAGYRQVWWVRNGIQTGVVGVGRYRLCGVW